MNPTDVFKLEKDGLESKLPNYEKNFAEKKPLTPITIQGIEYELLTPEYENLMQILTETRTEIKELKKYTEDYQSDKYFGIGIENGSITKLQISKYELQKIPTIIGQLTNLQDLNLRGNQISTIPAELGQLNQLQNLYLSYNKISTIPTEIGQLTKIQYLDLTNNEIIEIPAEIGKLTQLKELTLYNNKISVIPAEIGKLTQLQNLNLGSNQIKVIPAELQDLEIVKRGIIRL